MEEPTETDESLFHVGTNVELSRVVGHLCALVLAIFVFELVLHQFEHALERSPKFEKMVGKIYRELMVLGVVGFTVKVSSEASEGERESEKGIEGMSEGSGEGSGEGASSGDKNMLAWEVADIMIFILALALLLQATSVFLRFRKHNRYVERSELITTGDLVEWSSQALKTKHDLRETPWWTRWRRRRKCDAEAAVSRESLEELVKLRLLRRFFLKRFNLPELFPFAKYLRQAQDNQLTHMIDVELSTWMVLLAIAWGLDRVARALEVSGTVKDWNSAFLAAFVIFAWASTLLHVLVWRYFLSCVQQLLKAGGHTNDQQEMITRLAEIAREEAALMGSEAASDALNAMERAQELHHQLYEKKRAQRNRFLAFDTGFQLLATCWRNISAKILERRDPDDTLLRGSLKSGETDVSKRISSMQPPLHIRWFSRKAWHLLIIQLLMFNGFYTALLVHCGVNEYMLNLEDNESALHSIALALAMTTPLLINSVALQPRIIRHYVIVSNVFRIDAKTLGEVVGHFNEIVELRSEFVAAVSYQLQSHGRSAEYLQQMFAAHDIDGSGEIELSKLHSELKALGLNISAFRFNSVARLLFTIKGMRVEYAQILSMLALGNRGDFPSLPRRSMLRLGSVVGGYNGSIGDPGYLLIPETPELRRQAATEVPILDRPSLASVRSMPMLRREVPQLAGRGRMRDEGSFQGTSSRTLQQLFNANSIHNPSTDSQPIDIQYMVL